MQSSSPMFIKSGPRVSLDNAHHFPGATVRAGSTQEKPSFDYLFSWPVASQPWIEAQLQSSDELDHGKESRDTVEMIGYPVLSSTTTDWILYIPSGNILGTDQPLGDLPIPLSLGPPSLLSSLLVNFSGSNSFFLSFSPLPQTNNSHIEYSFVFLSFPPPAPYFPSSFVIPSLTRCIPTRSFATFVTRPACAAQPYTNTALTTADSQPECLIVGRTASVLAER